MTSKTAIMASMLAATLAMDNQPIHGDHLRGRLCIHAHLHSTVIPDGRYLCVSLEQNNYKAFDLEQIRDIYLNRIKSGMIDKNYLELIKRKLE